MIKDEILDLLEKLKTGKSPDPDGIHPRVLKELRNEIVVLLVDICNPSLISASAPEDWKVKNVT